MSSVGVVWLMAIWLCDVARWLCYGYVEYMSPSEMWRGLLEGVVWLCQV